MSMAVSNQFLVNITFKLFPKIVFNVHHVVT